jgi:hypothetical protein
MYNNNSSPTLTNVTFSGNYATLRRRDVNNKQQPDADQRHLQRQLRRVDGGGMLNNKSNPTLTNVTFSGNYGIGGGMYNSYSSPTLTNVTFSGNYGSAARCTTSTAATRR